MTDIIKDEQRRAIGAVRKTLRWEVKVARRGRHGDWDAYAMRSFPAEQRHEIYLPLNGNGLPHDKMSELHEYVHALLTETVHPMFGTMQIGSPHDIGWASQVRGIINEAVDWFVDGWIYTKHPIASRDRLSRNKAMLAPHTVEFCLARDPDPLFGAATFAEMAAELRRFANWDGNTGIPLVENMVNEFLATDCSTPSIEALAKLVNGLVPLELNTLIVPSCRDDGNPYWLVCRPCDFVPTEQGTELQERALAS